MVAGLVGAGVLWLASSPPRGAPIQLLPPPTPLPILVHVSGAVNSPGVYTLDPGSRVQEAIQAAGEFRQDAISQTINLAAALQDGSQLWIPSVSDAPAGASSNDAAAFPRRLLEWLSSSAARRTCAKAAVPVSRRRRIVSFRMSSVSFPAFRPGRVTKSQRRIPRSGKRRTCAGCRRPCRSARPGRV